MDPVLLGFDVGDNVKATVTELVKGGLILDVGLRGFMPASLVEMRRVRDLTSYLGRELEAKVIEVGFKQTNVVLSRRAFLQETRLRLLATLQKGQVKHGTVSSIVNFGVFIDLGGIEGLVAFKDLTWSHFNSPSEVVEIGQYLAVQILDIDMDRERVSLSLKLAQDDPWSSFANTHEIGQLIAGKVVRLVPFAAYIKLADGVEGFIHVSELSQKSVRTADQIASIGDEAMVRIIGIDIDRRRISLSRLGVDEEMNIR